MTDINPTGDQSSPTVAAGSQPTVPAASRSLRTEAFWLVPTLLALAGLTAILLLNPKWGADAAAIIALPLSVAGTVVALLSERGALQSRALKVPRNRRRTGRWVAALTVVALAGTLGVWLVRREGDPFDYMSGEVRVGYVAYEYRGWHTDATGGPVGFDVDVTREIESHFPDAHVVWVDLGTLDNRVKALQGDWTVPGSTEKQKRVKLVVANFSMTAKRAEKIDFAGPYFVDTQAFLSRRPVGDISEIGRDRVCVIKGSRSDEKLTQIGWKPLEELSLAACVNDYTAAKVDAVSDDRSLIAGYTYPLKLSPPNRLNYGSEKYGVAIPNNMPKLCREIGKVLSDFLTYSWSEAFTTNLAPLGLKESEYVKPTLEQCQSASPWYH
jgi:ABC-type amino acid transport substrate-binding protein